MDRKTHFVKVSVLPNLIYRFNAITIKIQPVYFMDIDTLIQKFIWRGKKTQNSQHNTEGEQSWRTRFRTYFKATIIKTQHGISKKEKEKQNPNQIDQWNRIESHKIDPQKYNQLIFDRGAKAIQWSKDSFFSKWCWNTWTSTCQKKSRCRLTTLLKINSNGS